MKILHANIRNYKNLFLYICNVHFINVKSAVKGFHFSDSTVNTQVTKLRKFCYELRKNCI